MGKISNALISWESENEGIPTLDDLIKQHKKDKAIINKIIKENKNGNKV